MDRTPIKKLVYTCIRCVSLDTGLFSNRGKIVKNGYKSWNLLRGWVGLQKT